MYSQGCGGSSPPFGTKIFRSRMASILWTPFCFCPAVYVLRSVPPKYCPPERSRRACICHCFCPYRSPGAPSFAASSQRVGVQTFPHPNTVLLSEVEGPACGCCHCFSLPDWESFIPTHSRYHREWIGALQVLLSTSPNPVLLSEAEGPALALAVIHSEAD
jgi:hypothetical protein